MEAKYILVLALLGLGLATAQATEDFEDFEPKRDDEVDTNPPIINEIKTTWKTKCDQNGGPRVYPRAERSFDKFKSCILQYLNVTTLQLQLEAAKPKGLVQEVFLNYCLLIPMFKNCFIDLTEDVKPCLSENEKENLKILFNVTDKLMEFACHNDGERLALFVAEDGVNCFDSKREQLYNCTEKHFIQNSTDYLGFGEKECTEMLQFQPCVVSALETCEKPTIANIADAMISYIFKSTPCKEFSERLKAESDEANENTFPTYMLVMAVVAAYMV